MLTDKLEAHLLGENTRFLQRNHQKMIHGNSHHGICPETHNAVRTKEQNN